jgi:hypothetical protein
VKPADDEDPPSERRGRSRSLALGLCGLGALRVGVALAVHERCGTEAGLAAGLVVVALFDLVQRSGA